MKTPDFFVESAEVKLAVYTWGTKPTAQQPKEVLVFAHGFPDRALFWEKVARHLEQDFYVVAFDQRGCAASTHISGWKHYKFEPLIKDLLAVIEAVSPDQKVHLIGHDWGGIYGWNAINSVDGRQKIASFITMSPSLEQVGFYLRQRLLKPTPKNLYQLVEQLLRNSLMTFFTLPLLPEILWHSGLGVFMMRLMFKHYENLTAEPFPGVEGDAIRYLGIYRANLFQRVLFAKRTVATVPVHLLLAERDPFLPTKLFEASHEWASNITQSYLDASHWAPLSRHAEMATAIRAFVGSLQDHQIGLPSKRSPVSH